MLLSFLYNTGARIQEALDVCPAAIRFEAPMCVRLGEDFSAHSLRSGFVTEAGRQNMPLQETMAMTGHRSVETIGGYFRAGAAQVSAVARMMDSEKSRHD